MIRLYLLAFLSLFTGSTVFGQTNADNKIEFTVDREYWEACETGLGDCAPLTLRRDSKQDSVLLVMPCGGTTTTVVLSGPGLEKPIQKVTVSSNDCPPSFDLTGLPDGKYEAYMKACGLGGGISFYLKTKNE